MTPNVLVNANDLKRNANVKLITSKFPFINRFDASYHVDASCLQILRVQKITISAQYHSIEKGHGWIHTGKVGNWCSFLRFLSACAARTTYATCVWIENDIRVSDEMLRILVMSTQDMLSGKEPFPIVHPGGSWEVVIVLQRRALEILRLFQNFQIKRPVDVEFWSKKPPHKLVSDKIQWRQEISGIPISISKHRNESSIVCSNCKLVTTQWVNEQIMSTIAQ